MEHIPRLGGGSLIFGHAADRVMAEADVLGDNPVAADREHLPYTEAAVKEALRLYPPATSSAGPRPSPSRSWATRWRREPRCT